MFLSDSTTRSRSGTRIKGAGSAQEFNPSSLITLKMVSRLTFLLTISAFAQRAFAVGTPFGQAAGTTGGGSATAQVPSSLAELTSWLSDGTARVILLDKIYDFTSAEGTVTGAACKPWTCSPNPQVRPRTSRSVPATENVTSI